MSVLILLGIMIFSISSSNKYFQFWEGYNKIVIFSVRPLPINYKFGIIGFFLSSIKIIEAKKTKKYLLLCIFILILLKIINNKIIENILKNLFSIILILIFASIPLDKLSFSVIIFIKKISSYTGGIYYIHYFLNSLLKKYISLKFISGNIFMCIILYYLCYLICFIGSNLFKNNFLKYLFI